MYLHYRNIELPALPQYGETYNTILKRRAENALDMWKKVDEHLISVKNSFWSEALNFAVNGNFNDLSEHVESSILFQETFPNIRTLA